MQNAIGFGNMTDQRQSTRRRVLKLTGAAASTALVAGCGGPGGDNETEGNGGAEEEPTGDNETGMDNETNATNETGNATNETGMDNATNETGNDTNESE